MTARAPKSPNNVTSTIFNTVHLVPKNLRFEHEAPNLLLPRALSNLVTSLSERIRLGQLCPTEFASRAKDYVTIFVRAAHCMTYFDLSRINLFKLMY